MNSALSGYGLNSNLDPAVTPAPQATPDFLQIQPPKPTDPYAPFGDMPWLGDLAETAAKRTTNRSELEATMGAAFQGVSPTQFAHQQDIENLRKTAADFVSKSAHLDDSQFKAAVEHLRGVQSQQPTLVQPDLKTPHWGALALGLLGAVADPTHGAQILTAPFQAQQQDQQKQIELARQRFAAQQDAYQSQVNAARGDVGLAQDELNRHRQDLLGQGQFANTQADQLARDDDRDQLRIDRIEQKNDTVSTQLLNNYYRAKSLPEMQDWAAKFNSKVTDPSLKIDPARVQGDFEAISATRVHQARADFGSSLDRLLNVYGEADGQNLKNLIQERDNIAKANGVDPKTLQSIPTGESLKKQAMADRKVEAAQKFSYLQKRDQDRIAERQASRDLAERRLTAMTSNQQFMQQFRMNEFNAVQAYRSATNDYRNASLALREPMAMAEGKLRAQIGDIDKKIGGVSTQIAHAPDAKSKAKLKLQLEGLQGQRNELHGRLPDLLQQQDILSQLSQVPSMGLDPVPSIYQPQPTTPQAATTPQQPSPVSGRIGAGTTKSGVKFRVIK